MCAPDTLGSADDKDVTQLKSVISYLIDFKSF